MSKTIEYYELSLNTRYDAITNSFVPAERIPINGMGSESTVPYDGRYGYQTLHKLASEHCAKPWKNFCGYMLGGIYFNATN